ncbi:ParB/RepB/Spo0J family partition protein [Legionella rowbothamii]|uniref:ParB/RepB/Spo0J family partition protein n=1 Tax=Legionella rowbothamii TaxID=96229 RepID=UPI001055E1FD|nr:ParB N-terminal domain-containing protein [Legionella rowbothamii]
MSIKKKIMASSLTSKLNKPDTITRAGITANLKFTRGKQLVEHDPFSLIPDPQNPRPGEIIDESWLRTMLHIGTEQSLCTLLPSGDYVIPEYSQLPCEQEESLEDSYNALRDLAFSIRNDGLIQPIEIFLADRQNDPDYFRNSNLEYGYVILEGHQRRLAAMMAGVPTVTCIEITDESMLAKLKVKHRKLRRQLSENNLRKGLTVSQNFQIVQALFSDPSSHSLTKKELSGIIGFNESIASALRSICTKPESYPPVFFSRIQENKLTFKTIRALVPKSYEEIEQALTSEPDLSEVQLSSPIVKGPKPRGRQGGAIKKSATFKVNNEQESITMQALLLSRFPEIQEIEAEPSFKSLESILHKIKEIAVGEFA